MVVQKCRISITDEGEFSNQNHFNFLSSSYNSCNGCNSPSGLLKNEIVFIFLSMNRIEILLLTSLFSQFIEIWGFNFGTITTYIGKTNIIA
jgi:hypothetical protein